MKNHFFLIFLIPPAVLAVSEICFFWQNLFFAGGLASGILIILSIKAITGEKIFSANFQELSLPALLFFFSSSAYALILPEKTFVQIIFFAQFLFLFYFLKNLREKERGAFLENVSSWGNFLSLFFVAAFLFGLRPFLGFSIVYSAFIFLAVIMLIVYENFRISKIAFSEFAPWLFLIPLILIQFVWTFYFLPLNHNILGIILALCYYMIIGTVKPLLRGKLTKKIIKFYLIGGIAGILMLLLAAKWI